MEIITGVYKIIIGGYFYIGSSKNILSRVTRHRYDLKTSKHRNRYMQRVFNKHQEMFYEVLERVDTEEMMIVEQKYIDRFYANRNCMNLSETVESPYKLPHKKKQLAETNRNRIWTTEMKNKLSASKLGKKFNEEFKRNKSIMNTGVNNPNAKLTTEQINSLPRMKESGYLTKDIASIFGVSCSCISRHLGDLGVSQRYPKKWSDERKANQKQKHTVGSKNYNSKLTEEKVRSIRKMLNEGRKQIDIGNEFGVKQNVISSINMGRSWRHVI